MKIEECNFDHLRASPFLSKIAIYYRCNAPAFDDDNVSKRRKEASSGRNEGNEDEDQNSDI
jgi:hypothetical protein